ncbi:hypothetical protein QT995_08530 [Microcoleus sp. S36b_A3]|uniref:hypothetical protein n=1 Tax=unclassified Microcoleus TaxID=2642155 RepID=UPI002FD4FCCD
MLAENLEITTPIDVDIIALDKDDRVVVLIEVKIIQAQEPAAKQRIADYMISWMKAVLAKISEQRTIIPYAMFVDTEEILIFKWNGENLSKPVCTLNTAKILHSYEPEFGTKWISERYLESLIESWLEDLAYNWKSEMPAASEQIARIGLLQRLAGGTTKSGVQLGNFVYRDKLLDEYCHRA